MALFQVGCGSALLHPWSGTQAKETVPNQDAAAVQNVIEPRDGS